MNKITKEILEHCADDFHQAHGQTFHAYILNENGGTSLSEIPRDVAETIRVGEMYMDYSIDRDIPIKHNFISAYKVIEKIFDENENIIVVTEKEEYIDV